MPDDAARGGARARAAGSAQAYRLLPAWWDKRTLIYASTATVYRHEVAAAARAWNRSGVRFRWKRGPRARADVVIKVRRNLPAAGQATSFHDQAGRMLRATIELRRDLHGYGALPRERRFVPTSVLAHEMGHVMGLDHDNRRCATMNEPEQASCARPAHSWRFRCRILEADDVRGAIRRYGGRLRALGQATCDGAAAPPLI